MDHSSSHSPYLPAVTVYAMRSAQSEHPVQPVQLTAPSGVGIQLREQDRTRRRLLWAGFCRFRYIHDHVAFRVYLVYAMV